MAPSPKSPASGWSLKILFSGIIGTWLLLMTYSYVRSDHVDKAMANSAGPVNRMRETWKDSLRIRMAQAEMSLASKQTKVVDNPQPSKSPTPSPTQSPTSTRPAARPDPPRPSASPTPKPIWPPQTSITCYQWGTWTEACHFENICFDPTGRVVYFYKPEVTANGDQPPTRRQKPGAGNDDEEIYSAVGWARFRTNKMYNSHDDLRTGQVLPLEALPTHDTILPANSAMRGMFVSAKDALGLWGPNPRVAGNASRASSAWITANRVQLSNIWYYSSRVTPWYELRKMNESFALPFVLIHPEMIFLQTTENLIGTDWHRSILALSLGVPKEALISLGNASSPRIPQVIYRSSTSNKSKQIKGKSAAVVNLQQNDAKRPDEQKPRCFSKAIITGASGFLFGTTQTASDFRADALRTIGLGKQPKFIGPGMPSRMRQHMPPKKVLLIDRKRGRPRTIINIREVQELLDAYGVPYTHLIDFKGSFEDQVRYYNSHGILLGVHGAGFINCMFMRQGSAVIEVFPYHVKHTLYMRQAYISGLTHFPVYITDPSTSFKKGNALKEYIRMECENMPSLMTQWKDNACRGPLIASPVRIPLRELEMALVNALDMIGYRTEYRGIHNNDALFTSTNKVALQDILNGVREFSPYVPDTHGQDNEEDVAAPHPAAENPDPVDAALVEKDDELPDEPDQA